MSRFKELRKLIFVPKVFWGLMLYDLRNGLNVGTVGSVCRQHGAKILKDNDYIIISGPRDRMQIVLKYIHFSGIKYYLDKKPDQPK